MKLNSTLKKWLYNKYTANIPDKLSLLLKEQGVPDEWILPSTIIIHKLSNMPWYTQDELLRDTKLSKEDLIELNSIIRNSDILQDVILNVGLGKKYWNTIIPLLNTGSVDNVINYKYNFPLRLGIYPGISCMFYCGFCGRNQQARYRSDIQGESLEMFKDIFKAMPKTSTISISGGLEPLTHSKIGEIISIAKSCGIRVPLITNANNLTNRFVEIHPGILELDSLRVSLYGIDEESTYLVTRKKGAYNLVKNNIINFLKLRNKSNPNLKVGLNYIVIPENVDHVPKLIDYIAEVNNNVDGPGIDFITIREDFGSVTDTIGDDIERTHELDGFLSASDRKILIDTFKEFNRKKEIQCPTVKVDFGYALVQINEGILGDQIKMVRGTDMRKSAYPQVSVAVDSYGDVFLYREAGFLDRPGNDKFIIGRISKQKSLEDIIVDFINNKKEIKPHVSDARFMDAFDHLATVLINQAQDDKDLGIPFELGPVSARNVIDVEKTTQKKNGLFGTIHQ
jgi:dTDP-4-amino-4,6-dideoxy-D-glucose ammonia-lyase